MRTPVLPRAVMTLPYRIDLSAMLYAAWAILAQFYRLFQSEPVLSKLVAQNNFRLVRVL